MPTSRAQVKGHQNAGGYCVPVAFFTWSFVLSCFGGWFANLACRVSKEEGRHQCLIVRGFGTFKPCSLRGLGRVCGLCLAISVIATAFRPFRTMRSCFGPVSVGFILPPGRLRLCCLAEIRVPTFHPLHRKPKRYPRRGCAGNS